MMIDPHAPQNEEEVAKFNFGNNEFIQDEVTTQLLAYKLHDVLGNTGITFKEYLGMTDENRTCVLEAVKQIETTHHKESIKAYRGAINVNSPSNKYTDINSYINSRENNPYPTTLPIPPWMQNNTPPWAKAGMGMPTGNIRQPAFNIMNLHDSLRTILVAIPFLEATSLSTYFDFQGRSISVSHALKFIYEGIKQNPAIDTNQNKF